MEEIGLFTAKTRLSELCAKVAGTGEPICITRRGQPWVQLCPLAKDPPKPGIWELREQYEEENGRLKKSFELPERAQDNMIVWR